MKALPPAFEASGKPERLSPPDGSQGDKESVLCSPLGKPEAWAEVMGGLGRLPRKPCDKRAWEPASTEGQWEREERLASLLVT